MMNFPITRIFDDDEQVLWANVCKTQMQFDFVGQVVASMHRDWITKEKDWFRKSFLDFFEPLQAAEIIEFYGLNE
jgi:hypothetical protein